MRHKFFSWESNDGYRRGGDLLPEDKIFGLLKNATLPCEVFASIQDYDEEGNCIGCPMYFDIDASSLYDAYEELVGLYKELFTEYGVLPLVWYSGGKGFHVVMPLYIRHSRCHEIVRMIAEDLPFDLDLQVYRTRAMWRCNNTYNKLGRAHKVPVNIMEGLDSMIAAAKSNRITPVTWDLKDMEISEYISQLPTLSDKLTQLGSDFERDFRPCMRAIWEGGEPPSGYRHQFAHIIARHCYRSGLTQEEAIGFFNGHKYWKTVSRGEGHYPEKIIKSVYRTGKAMIGCKNGRDADLLRDYCSKLCGLRDDVSIKEYVRWN